MTTKWKFILGIVVLLGAAFLLPAYFVQSGNEPLQEIAKAIEAIEKFVDATIEEDCDTFSCPPGTIREDNLDYKSVSNGCGSFGFEWKEDILPDKELKNCCNIHDNCYDECGSDKDMCDLQFKRCLYRVCAKKADQMTPLHNKACKASAKVMYTGTLALGCKAYQDAQQQACRCVRTEL